MSNIIAHDFGKEDREHLRRFCRLMGILEQHEVDVLADPIKYLRDAGKAVADMRAEIFHIWEIVAIARSAKITSMRDSDIAPSLSMDDTMRVMKDEHMALKEVYRRVAILAGMSS